MVSHIVLLPQAGHSRKDSKVSQFGTLTIPQFQYTFIEIIVIILVVSAFLTSKQLNVSN